MSSVTPAIDTHPQTALIDQPVSIRVAGLQPRQIVSLTAALDLPDGLSYLSEASFIADMEGNIDLDAAVPLNGSYATADSNGLIWSLKVAGYSQRRPESARYVESDFKPYDIRLRLYDISNHLLAQNVMTRLAVAPDVTRRDVRESGIVGTLFTPVEAQSAPRPAIIVVPGSNGGIPEQLAALYASHGYNALALGYFNAGEEGILPKELVEIPLEYFQQAAQWLKSQPHVDEERVIIDGTSRGGELALLLGAYLDEFMAVIAWVPAAHVHHAFSSNEDLRQRSAWTLQGKPLPFVPPASRLKGPRDVNLRSGSPVSHIEFLRMAASEPYFTQAAIPVENINGPVLLISGRDDVMWPSAFFADWVVERLKKTGFAHDVQHLSYENVGHTIGPPHAPATILESYEKRSQHPYLYGGSAESIAKARVDVWPQVLRFIEKVNASL